LDAQGNELTIYREPLPPCVPGIVLIEQIYFRRWRFDSPVYGTVMARRSAYESVGPFDSRFGFFSDVDMWLRLASRFDVAYIEEPLISLPSRKALPRLYQDEAKMQQILERMWLEARVRQYSDRPARLVLEEVRHFYHVAKKRAWILAVALAAQRKRFTRS
jgi:hypothetical protein